MTEANAEPSSHPRIGMTAWKTPKALAISRACPQRRVRIFKPRASDTANASAETPRAISRIVQIDIAWSARSVGQEQTERMTGRIEHHPDMFLWLVFGLTGTGTLRPLHC